MKYKFPSETKANLFISLIKAQMYDEYKNRSECLSVEFINAGEGQLLSIARYNTKKTLMKLINGQVQYLKNCIKARWCSSVYS